MSGVIKGLARRATRGSECSTGAQADKKTGDITTRILMRIILLDYHYCLFFHYILSMNSIIVAAAVARREEEKKTFSATLNC